MSAEEQAEYAAEAEKFLDVTAKMVDCTWTPQEHAWLARRNRSRLELTESGRKTLKAFADAPLLMDGRQKKGTGEAGAIEVNERELQRLSSKTGRPMLQLVSYHDKPQKEAQMIAEDLDESEFRGLSSKLRLCEGARVLLTHNEWVEAGLMNGALGWVRGFVWPE